MVIGERIGQGLTADIHVRDPHRIVKLFRENVPLSTILREYLSLSGCSVRQAEEWELPVAAARLAEGVSESEKKRLLKRVEELLEEIP